MNLLDDIFDQVYDKKNNVMLKNDAYKKCLVNRMN